MTAAGRGGAGDAPPAPLGIADAGDHVEVVAGRFEPGLTSLFSIFRDEMYFCPAFFDHYRGIGVEQFVIIDDASTDGTREFLLAQPDCVTLAADMRYGDALAYRDPNGRISELRFGVYAKIAVPHMFVEDAYVLYLDADEFLILPPGVARVAEVIERLASEGADGLVASVVEFFPRSITDLDDEFRPASFDDLLGRFGHFQPAPLVAIDAGGRAQPCAESKSTRLFMAHGIKDPPRGWRRRIGHLFDPRYRHSPRHKTPIMRRSADSFLTGTHGGNRPAPRHLMLTAAHFVFTSQFRQKIDRARRWRSYVRNSDKYDHYDRLMQAMSRSTGSFLDRDSTRYTGPEQLIAAGLMRW